MTELSPAPEFIDELSMCKWTIGCLTQRFKCKKNGFVCSKFCYPKNLYPEDFVADS